MLQDDMPEDGLSVCCLEQRLAEAIIQGLRCRESSKGGRLIPQRARSSTTIRLKMELAPA